MKGSIVVVLISVVGLAVGWTALSAQTQVPVQSQDVIGWSTNGPYGGNLFNVAVDPVSPTVAYVAAQQTGVFGTQNGGQTWSLLLHDPDWLATSNECLVTHPELPGTVFFVGSHDLYKSDDYGHSWTSIQCNGQPIAGRIVVVDPGDPNRVFVGLGTGKVLRSLDGGNNWTEYSVGMPANSAVDSIALDPKVTSILYAGSRDGGGIYRSTSSSESWEPTSGQPLSSDMWSLAVSPYDRRVWYGGWYGPLSYSTDQGKNWYTLTVGTAPPMHNWVTIQFHPVQTQTMLVGDIASIRRSTDLGGNWQELVGGGGWDIAIHPIQTSTLYAVGNGVKLSTDDGATWEVRNQGVTAVAPREIAVAQDNPARLLVGTEYGSGFYSLDGGQNWSESDVSIYHAVAVDPVSSTLAYIGWGNRIFRTENSGVTWTLAGELSLNGLPAYINRIETRALAIHPITPTLIYAGVGFGGDEIPVLQEGGAYRSDDSGTTWQRIGETVPISRVNTIVIAPSPPYAMYLATGRTEHHLEQGNGLFRSLDGGQTWMAINTDLPDLNMRTVAVNPRNPQELLSAPWEQGNYGGGLGVYRSTDGGDTWNAANAGLTALTVENLEYDPVGLGVVYAATWNGLGSSMDGGLNWNRWNDAMGRVPVLSLAAARLSADESVVYVGVIGGSSEPDQSGISPAATHSTVQGGVYSRTFRWYHAYLPIAQKE